QSVPVVALWATGQENAEIHQMNAADSLRQDLSPLAADSKSWFRENKTFFYMSYVPTFGSLMSSVLGRSENLKTGCDEPCESFVGVATASGEGIVDTAAQDGLIGKAALLQFTETLRGFGLQIRWNHEKKAQASGVGGKAKVIGIAELPIGLAGVNGLLEATVVQDNVPLLLPIKLLRQLRAVVDLDDNLLRLKAYGVETRMHELPSGHMSVSVTSYAPEGWSLPRDAQSHALKPDQYVLATSGFLNQSMSFLKSSKARSVKFDTGDLDGKFATAPDDGSEGQGCAGASRETGSVSSQKPPGSEEVENGSREAGRLDDVRTPSRKGYRMAARWLLAAVGANIASNGAGFSYYAPGVFLNGNGKEPPVCTMTVCPHPAVELKGSGNQYSKEIWCNRCKARWEYLNPEKLAQAEYEKNQAEELRTSGAMNSRAEVILCTCRKEAVKLVVKKAGPTQGRHFYKCKQRVCEFFLWDPTEQEKIRKSEGAMDLEIEEDSVKNKMEAMMNAQAIAHQREVDELRTQLAWMQGFAQQWQMAQMAQNPESGSMDGFQMVQDPQTAAVQCAQETNASIWLVVSYTVEYAIGKCILWQLFLVKFEDENSMILWSEEDGKHKALSAGEKKKTMKALDDALKSAPVPCRSVLEAVSPARIQCFVEYGNLMATLDPSCSNQFWQGIKERNPEMLILRPDRDDLSVKIAADAADWQHARGKVFALVCQDDRDIAYYEDVLDQGCVFQQHLPSSEVILTNYEALGDKMKVAMEEDRVLSPEDTNDLLQNPKAHQSENEHVAQNAIMFPEDTDDLLQNPETHQSFLFDVCQEHGGPFTKDVCQEHGGPLSEQFLSSSMAVGIEQQTKKLLQQQDYSLMSLEKLLMTLPLLQPRNRQSTMQGSYFSLGLFAHGNHYGTTKLCEKLPTFTRYLNKVMQYQCRCQGWTDAVWTTIAIGQNAGSTLHRDNHNQPNTLNYIFSLGRHCGGELWTEADVESCPTKSRTQWKELPSGDWVCGCLHDIHYKPTRFNPKKWHASAKWAGQRFIVSAFTSRAVERVGRQAFEDFKSFGFPLRTRRWTHMFNGETLSVEEDTKVYVEEDQEFAPLGDDLLDELPAQGEEDQGADPHMDLEPTREEKRLVLKLHENMGHPAPREMARAMRIARVKPHILRYIVKKFSCAVCDSKPKPKPSRPAVLPRTYEPGRVVGVDVIWLGSLDRRQCFPALNIVDWGTGYSMVERLKNTEATHTWRTFMRTWGRTFGVPEMIVADLGSEFRGHFAQMAGEAGALIRHTAARSPWQAGKTERAGSHFKWVYDKARDSTFVSTWEEIKTLMLEVECARNRYGNRSGFSPMQRQIGHNLRLPGSLLSDDHLDPSLVIQSSGEEMRRVLEIRKAAQEAYMKSQTETAITKAKNARVRIQVEFLPGETVYVYRQPKERKRRHVMTPEAHEGRKASWVGPGVVLAVEKPSLWISMKGELWKVSQEQCRHATSEEQVAKEMLAGELEALREELGRTSLKRTYRDMTGESHPPDEDEVSSHRHEGGVGVSQGDVRPSQRLRVGDPSQIPIPEDEELDYEPSYEDGEQGQQQPQGELPQPPQQPQEFTRTRTESEPEPLPTPQRTLTPETARAVQRNEELDGNFKSPSYRAVKELAQRRPPSSPYFVESKAEKGQHGWFYFEKNKWEFEADQWEFVNPNVIIRRHYLPRDRLCNPNKVQGALMPRRLKLRQSYMVTEDGKVDKVQDMWFKERKNTCKTKNTWTGFTVFSNKEVNIENYVTAKARG
ncbi:Top3a, partial [Symbiodinium necroappetens]